MDEFGVLTERYGLKPQGKSMPMSQAKRSTATTDRRFGSDSSLNRNPTSFSSRNSSPGNSSSGLGDDFAYDFGGFGNPNTNTSNNSSGNGSSVDLASMLFNSGPKSSSYVVDDLFGGMPASQNAKNNNDAYHFGSFVSSTKQKAASSGDLLGDFSGVAAKLKSSNRNASWDSAGGFDDLVPGFGGTSPPPFNRTSVKTTKSTLGSSEEPFFVFESDSGSEFSFSEAPTADPLEEYSVLNHSGGTKPRGSSNASQPLRPPKPAQVLMTDKVKSSGASPIDELEDFAMGREHNKSNRSKEAEDTKKTTRQNREDDLESFFAVHSRSTSAPKSRATTLDPMFEQNTHNRQQKPSAGASSTAKKASPVPMTAGMDDLSFIFGAASVFGEFEEVAGESEERRTRLERHQRTQDQMARAVADMNQRDRRSENEQEERRRIAEAMDFEIKRWAAGKEGNMRALLSSLQQVLWSECGWEPVSLTDLITSGSVKKVYRKATLCVHPDKVLQKGATLEQKYIAEKIFDILKEAWNKFNKEELS